MKNVRVIEAVKNIRPKQRIGVYVRVSTDSSDQQNSYASQIGYYTSYIEKHSDWELIDVYADEGITGTKLDKRDEFLRMMRDARLGKLDIILVKSASRFARNVVDCLTGLRELFSLGVEVKFDKENLKTEALTSELMVSVSASLAQEESISMSQNMRWSYQKRMQSGEFITTNAPFGYRLQGKHLYIKEDEADVVRWVFDSYLDGLSMREIAEMLTATTHCTSEGKKRWLPMTISYMLQNEKYIGDSLGQKKYNTETFPFREVINRGEKPKYYAENTHPAILDRDTFERVQVLIRSRRPANADIAPEKYPLTKKITCGYCGTTFIRRTTKKGIVVWVCMKRDKGKDQCEVGRIPQEEIYSAFVRMVNKLMIHHDIVLRPAISQLQELEQAENRSNSTMLQVAKEIASLQEKSQTLNKLRERNLIPADSFLEKNAQLTARLADLKKQRRLILEANDSQHNILHQLKKLSRTLRESEEITEFDEQLFLEIVEKVIVDSQEQLRFRLIGGLELPETIKGKLR